MNTWFEVDKKGLAKVLERRGLSFVMFELVSNAWDENVTRVDVNLRRIAGSRNAELTVEDDSPEGFSDLSHAWKLFAESAKKSSGAQRGRFNAGEKLVLALCNEASIASTTGTVVFDADGRRVTRAKRPAGSMFTGVLKMTEKDIHECLESAMTMIPPKGVRTTINGVEVAQRTPLATIEVTLPTELGDEEGVLRRTERKTLVEVYEPLEGETPALYELGIPVVDTSDRWHINIGQKVPLTIDRTNVTPSYLARVRAVVVELMANKLEAQDANSTWVRDAVQRHGDDLPDEAVRQIVALRFGEKAVAFDPSDPEANHRAVAEGYNVVYGGNLSREEWSVAKRAGVLKAAGAVMPTPKPFSPEGNPLKLVRPEDYTPAIAAVVKLARDLAKRVLKHDIAVSITNDFSWQFAGAYGGSSLTLSLTRLGHKWFEGPIAPIVELLVHEFGHERAPNHLSSDYHDALCELAGKVAAVALREPQVFAHWAELETA